MAASQDVYPTDVGPYHQRTELKTLVRSLNPLIPPVTELGVGFASSHPGAVDVTGAPRLPPIVTAGTQFLCVFLQVAARLGAASEGLAKLRSDRSAQPCPAPHGAAQVGEGGMEPGGTGTASCCHHCFPGSGPSATLGYAPGSLSSWTFRVSLISSLVHPRAPSTSSEGICTL